RPAVERERLVVAPFMKTRVGLFGVVGDALVVHEEGVEPGRRLPRLRRGRQTDAAHDNPRGTPQIARSHRSPSRSADAQRSARPSQPLGSGPAPGIYLNPCRRFMY